MEENSNPFYKIHMDILEVKNLIEQLLEDRQNPTPIIDSDKYEGIEIAVEELGCKRQTVYQRIDKIPHRKVHGKLLFNRAELRQYIQNEGVKK